MEGRVSDTMLKGDNTSWFDLVQWFQMGKVHMVFQKLMVLGPKEMTTGEKILEMEYQ